MHISLREIEEFLNKELALEKPDSILDIGLKYGLCEHLNKNGFEFSKNIKIDGVLGAEYKGEKNFYNKLYLQSFEGVIPNLGKYDVIFCFDILKGFSIEKRLEIIKELLLYTNGYVLICNSLSSPDGKKERAWGSVDFKGFDFVNYKLQGNDNNIQIIKVFPVRKKSVKSIDYVLLQDLSNKTSRSLNITYILPHKMLTGGLKMLILQIEQLRLRGHKVNVMLKADDTVSALPDFYSIEVDKDIVISSTEKYVDHISNEDVIVAGYCSQLEELESCGKPVVYWEQGSEYLFGECFKQEQERNMRRFLEKVYRTNTHIISVSPYVQEVLVNKYGRYTRVLPSYIDTEVFTSTLKPALPKECTILLVGNPVLAFKGLEIAIQALETVWNMGYTFQVKWILQNRYAEVSTSFPIEYIYSPKHKQLVKHYQEADILLWTSWYEGFGMPPLEAMATGTPVISTKCGGVETYAEHLVNSILVDPGDIRGMAAAIVFLLTKDELRTDMGRKGRETALHFSYEKGIEEFESILYTVVENGM